MKNMYNQNKHTKKDAIPLRYPKDSFTWMLWVERGLEIEDGTYEDIKYIFQRMGQGGFHAPWKYFCNSTPPASVLSFGATHEILVAKSFWWRKSKNLWKPPTWLLCFIFFLKLDEKLLQNYVKILWLLRIKFWTGFYLKTRFGIIFFSSCISQPYATAQLPTHVLQAHHTARQQLSLLFKDPHAS